MTNFNLQRSLQQENSGKAALEQLALLCKNSFVQQNESIGKVPTAEENSKGISRTERSEGDGLLNKLFADVIGIVQTHFDSRSKFDGEGAKFPIGDGNSGERWQKLYEDVYFELEKVRKLLLSEHRMNVQLQEEKRLLLAELDFTKTQFEKQLAQLKGQLEEKRKQIVVLENELEFVATSGQIRHTVLSTGKSSVNEHSVKTPTIEPTEMKLQISKVVLTEEAVRQAQNPCPMLFLAVEFFDFEIQTTKVANGPEALFDFTTVFDTPISDLFVHYVQTEGMEIELYSVRDGLSYELWAKAQIPLKKLLSTQTPTKFHGELKFRALSQGQAEEAQQKGQPMLLATAFYSIVVPFPLLSALNAQRRRMVASAMIPVGKGGPSDEPFNELIVHIHRCTAIDSLKGNAKAEENAKRQKQKPSTYVAYEFFNFPVHLTRTVRESANPIFDDRQNWKVPADSEAVHKYLKEKDLLFYLIDEGTDDGTSAEKMSPNARVLAFAQLPLFPLARNHKIRGTFPFFDKADESITSESSIDVSIYWKFAYVFDGFENLKLEKVPMRTFTPLTEQNGTKENGQMKTPQIATENGKNEQKDILPEEEEKTKRAISKEQKALERVGIRQRETEEAKGTERNESEETEKDQRDQQQMSEEELRRRLLLLPKPMEKVKDRKTTHKTIEMNGQKRESEEETSEANASEQSEETPKSAKSSRSSATIVVDREKPLERTTSDELSEDLLKEDSSNSAEGDHRQEKEEAAEDEDEEDDRSIRSDATYTAEGPLGPIEMDELLIKGREEDEEVMIIRDEDLERRTAQSHAEIGNGEAEEEKEKPTEAMAPVPAPRRSLLDPMPMKKLPAPLPPAPTAEEFATTRKAVEFAEPLHSSIPPSDVSSSFAEDVTFGSERSSNSSAEANSGGSTASNGSPRNGEHRQQKGEEGEEKQREKQRKVPRAKRPTKAPIEIAPAPPTPAIRSRPAAPEESDSDSEGLEDSLADLVPPNSAKVRIRIGKLRLLDHSSSLHFPQFDEDGRVFVEWNFLDFAREQCVTENDAEMPRLATEAADFGHQSDYELSQKQIALLTQWTQLNIRLTFTLVMDPGEANGGDLDDLCMGELELLNILDTSEHFLLMQNFDNLSVAELEVDISYSDNLSEYMDETMRRFFERENRRREKFQNELANG